MAHVLTAVDAYTDQKNDVPAPSDLIALMTPPAEKRISGAEFIHAKEQWELEGFPSYSYYATVVKDYERQNAEDRAPKQPVINSLLKERVNLAIAEMKQGEV